MRNSERPDMSRARKLERDGEREAESVADRVGDAHVPLHPK